MSLIMCGTLDVHVALDVKLPEVGQHLPAHSQPLRGLGIRTPVINAANPAVVTVNLVESLSSSRANFSMCHSTRGLGHNGLSGYIPAGWLEDPFVCDY